MFIAANFPFESCPNAPVARECSALVPYLHRLQRWLVAAALVAQCSCAQLSAAPPTPQTAIAVDQLATPADHKPLSTLVAVGKNGAVTSAEVTASEVGRATLMRGGNAVDAAVAVGFALSVTHPSAANIGGGGFMLVRTAQGDYAAIDYREVAPRAAQRDMFSTSDKQIEHNSRRGPWAAGIPGVVAGLALAHEKYGRLPWASLIEPAIALARDGVELDRFHADELSVAARATDTYLSELDAAGGALPGLRAAVAATHRAWTTEHGTAYRPGELFRQPALARTLRQIAQDGPAAFYRGPLAREIANRMHAMGGLWTEQDLDGYKALERKPIVFMYHDYEIATMPPPSAGGIVLQQILAASELLGLDKLDWDSTRRIHLYVEILRRTYADRNRWLGDPDFIDIPVQQLASNTYLSQRMQTIDPAHATPSTSVRAGTPLPEGMHTTHFSVADSEGMAVSNTVTLNTDFGALVQILDTGVILNNEMDDFAARPGTPNVFGLVQGAQNAIAPGKRMLSSMTPTIVSSQGKLRAVLGSPGGPTITTTVAQLLMQWIDHHRTLREAIAAPRLHHQWLPDTIVHEPGVPGTTLRALEQFGHQLLLEPVIGHANCIEVDPASGVLQAIVDSERGGGGASAY